MTYDENLFLHVIDQLNMFLYYSTLVCFCINYLNAIARNCSPNLRSFKELNFVISYLNPEPVRLSFCTNNALTKPLTLPVYFATLWLAKQKPCLFRTHPHGQGPLKFKFIQKVRKWNMWIVLVLTGLVIVISYVFYALRQTSGSEFAGNSLDDFILTKGGSLVVWMDIGP